MSPCLAAALVLLAQDRPSEFVGDEAGVIPEADIAAIRTFCREALDRKAVPIIVVTLRNLPEFATGAPMPIEWHAADLFRRWGIGWPEWNRGILLLLAVENRTARIELGAGWGREGDGLCRQIMDELVVPRCKAGEYGRGLLDGVRGLHAMALELPVPRGRWKDRLLTPSGLLWTAAVLFGLALLGSLLRGGGPHGCAPFGIPVLGLLLSGWLLRESERESGGCLGGRGGGFGGGFSGGGGATGSW